MVRDRSIARTFRSAPSVLVLGLLLAFSLPTVATAQCLNETKLTASDAGGNDSFGYGVSVSGDVVVIGAPFEDEAGFDAGAAYVYRFDGTTWLEEQKLTAADATAGHRFGYSVSLDGDVVVIGALTLNNGAAYVFRFNGTTWIQEQKLVASDGANGDEFGFSVSLSGDVTVVGARLNDEARGSAYVYRFDGTTWGEEQKLVASDAATDNEFGVAVSVSGDAALVGSHVDTAGGSDSGSAYVFRFDGSTWSEEQKLLASDAEAGDRFGWSLSLSGDVAMVGAFLNDDNGADSGSAYVFSFDGTNWVEDQKMVPDDNAPGDTFGEAISLNGNIAVIGAYRNNDVAFSAGAAYVYAHDGTSWVEATKLLASDGAAHDWFGVFSVSVSPERVVVNARLADGVSTDSGSVYIFELGEGVGDCNGNGIFDLTDIADGTSNDADDNCLPDECQAAPIPALTCTPNGIDVDLSWTNGDVYSSVEVSRDGTLIATLAGSATGYTDNDPGPGPHDYAVQGFEPLPSTPPASCSTEVLNFILSTTSAEGPAGSQASIQVLLDVPGGGVQGWSYGLCSDDAVLSAAAATSGATTATVNAGMVPDFESIQLAANGVTHAVVISFTDPDNIVLGAGSGHVLLDVTYTLVGDQSQSAALDFCDTAGDPMIPVTISQGYHDNFPDEAPGTITIEASADFLRGDCNDNGIRTVVDPIFLLGHLFGSGDAPNCADACDMNDDGELDVSDASAFVDYYFGMGTPLPDPFTSCDQDPPTGDALRCLSFVGCP